MKKWILLLCGILPACQTMKHNAEDDIACQTINLATVFDTEPQKVQLDEWAKSVRYIPLETNDSVLLTGFIPHLILQDNKLVLFNKDRLYLFDQDGTFVRTIGKRGEGPEDFISISNIWADNNGIYLADNNKWIKTYGWDGKWKKTSSIPANKNIQEIMPLSDGRTLGYIQNISGKEPIRMHIFRDTTILQSIPYSRSYEPGTITMVFYNECKVFDSPEGDYVKEMFNDTIYRVTEKNTVVPRWAIDAGKYKIPEGIRFSLKDPRDNIFANTASMNIIGICNNTLYMTSRTNKNSYLLCYDTEKQETQSVTLPFPENSFAFNESATFVPRFISDDHRYLIGFEAQENDENPVIVLAER